MERIRARAAAASAPCSSSRRRSCRRPRARCGGCWTLSATRTARPPLPRGHRDQACGARRRRRQPARPDRAVHAGRPGRRAGRPARAAAADALARGRDRRRLVARRPARLPAGAVRVLGERLRLAARGGAPERARAVPDRDRRARHPLPARSLAAAGCPAAGPHPRLAGLGRRVPEGDRAADRPGAMPADAFHVVCPSLPGYGFSDKPARPGWGTARIAARVGGADGPARLRALRRAGRRLGRHGHDAAGRASTPSTSPAST